MIKKTALALSILLSGFAADAAKPDFAFPKEVSKTASKELKEALKADNGPATLRALMNLTLAQGIMEPDSVGELEREVARATAKSKNSVTKAMTLLLRSDITGKREWADSALFYTDALRAASVGPWLKAQVIKADSVFVPTLYDFAVQKSGNDSLYAEAALFHLAQGQLLPYFKWATTNCTRERGWELYEKYSSDWQAYYLLLRLNDWDEKERTWAAADRWLKEHGSAPKYAVDRIKWLVQFLTRPEAEIKCMNVTKLGDPVSLEITSNNANKVNILVYETAPASRLLRTESVEFPGTGVFRVDTVIKIGLPAFGTYKLVPQIPGGSVSEKSSGCEVAVTDFLLEGEHYSDEVTKFFALDPVSGAVQTDVSISQSPKNENRVFGVRGADKYSPTCYGTLTPRPKTGISRASTRSTASGDKDDEWAMQINTLTDRSIYHPGDSVRFVSTAYEYYRSNQRLLKNHAMTVKLFDANGKLAAKVDGTTDGLGRFHGILPIPSTGLTGNFRIEAESGFNTYVNVSDYKAPDFEVSLSAQRLGNDSVRIEGTAISYSGFPVQDAKVRLHLYSLNPTVWFRDFRNGGSTYLLGADAVTDASGKFSLTVAVPIGESISANAIFTSTLGESHEDWCFIPGKPYFINSAMPTCMVAPSSSSWAPPVSVVDAVGKTVDIPLTYTLVGVDSVKFYPSDAWDKVPSGKYKLVISAGNPDLAADRVIEDFVIYRVDDKMPPYETALWVPVSKVNSGEKITLGSSYEGSSIRCVLWTVDSVLSSEWLTPVYGNRALEYSLPDGVDDAVLTLWTMRNYRLESRSVAISRADALRDLRIEVSSLRDRVTPGDRETWTVKITDNLGKPVPNSAVVMDVYSKALDALAPHSLSFYPRFGRRNYLFVSPQYPSFRFGENSLPIKHYPEMPDAYGQFVTYGMGWHREHVYYATSKRLMMARGVLNDLGEDFVMEEAVAETFAAGASAEAESEESADAVGEAPANDSYRLPEVPLALWQPVLTTDADGFVQVRFDVPNANTTWALKALTYDSRLLTGRFDADIVASKPVMVQTRLPRFLRNGDVVTLRASAVNNTDSAAVISAFVELFDPITGKEIKRADFAPERLAAMSTRQLDVPLAADSLGNLLGVRVRATAGHFTDGEQTVIPILPSDVTVMESTPILISADSVETVIDVKPGSVLQLTSNAAWECVTALPGILAASNNQSLPSLVNRLFSAAAADGLLRKYPEIGRAIHQWENTDSTLVSRLQKNEDLKIALLKNTPWVSEAESDSERMARLSLLLDRRQIKSTIDDAVKGMARLTRNGGLCWIAGEKEPSLWMTIHALSQLAKLKQMGCLPADKRLDKIISDALAYCDLEVARDHARNPKDINMDYAYMRTWFTDVVAQSTASRKVSTEAVQNAVSHWRDFSFTGRAKAALFLNANGYHTSALRIVESLRQTNAWRQTSVTPWVLRAFAVVDPSATSDIDAIRLWMLGQKQAQDWRSTLNATDVIYSFVTSGTDWLVPSANSISVKVNGRETPISAEDTYVGFFRISLPEGGEVSVTKGRFPLWGGVWSRYEAAADSVEATAGRELRIERTISGPMTVGSKVTVTLTVTADRNMDYVTVVSPHCAGMEPVSQLAGETGSWWWRNTYVEPTAQCTNFFLTRLPKGKTVIEEEYYVTADGTFILAPAEAQSQYAPEFSATSDGTEILVSE